MKTRITLKNTLQPTEDYQGLFDKFQSFWKSYINDEVKRKFQCIISKHITKITTFRTKWGIPEEGFATESKFRDWLGERIKNEKRKTKGLSCWQRTIPYESLGLILKEKRVTEKTITPHKRKGLKASFTDIFQKEAQEFARDIGMDNTWYLQFEDYLLFDTPDMRSIKDAGVKVSKKLKGYFNQKPFTGSVVLEIGPNTRLKDIQFIWQDQIEKLQQQLPGRINLAPNEKPKRIKRPQ